jgi:hypothetical protein
MDVMISDVLHDARVAIEEHLVLAPDAYRGHLAEITELLGRMDMLLIKIDSSDPCETHTGGTA